MIPRLLTSAFFVTIFIYLGVTAIHMPDRTTEDLFFVGGILLCGYHREIVSNDDKKKRFWWHVERPIHGQVHVIDTMWGLKINKPRVTRVRARVLRFAKEHPRREVARQIMPVVMRWIAPRTN